QSVTVQNEPGLSLPYPSVYMDSDALADVLDQMQDLGVSKPNTQLAIRSDNFIAAGDVKETMQKMKAPPANSLFLAHCYSNDPQSTNKLLPKGAKALCGQGKTIEYGMGECSATGQPQDRDFS